MRGLHDRTSIRDSQKQTNEKILTGIGVAARPASHHQANHPKVGQCVELQLIGDLWKKVTRFGFWLDMGEPCKVRVCPSYPSRAAILAVPPGAGLSDTPVTPPPRYRGDTLANCQEAAHRSIDRDRERARPWPRYSS